MMLREVVSPLFSYLLEASHCPQVWQQSFADLQEKIMALLKQQRAVAVSQNIRAGDYDAAEFAVIAWMDELIVQRATQAGNQNLAVAWQLEPLQRVLLHLPDMAGDDFYQRLADLTPEQSDVREIYYFCLRLGFKGKYAEERDLAAFADLCRRTAQQLSLPESVWRIIPPPNGYLIEQPYRVATVPPRWGDWFLWVGSALALTVIGTYWFIN